MTPVFDIHPFKRSRALASDSQKYQKIDMKTKAKLIGICVFLIMALASCIMVESSDYPASWPSAVHTVARQCPNISGRYRSIGTCVPGSGVFFSGLCDTTSLGSAFTDWPASDNAEAGTVDINLRQPNLLEIKINIPDKPSVTKSFIKDAKNDTYWKGGMVWDQHVLGYSCSNEGLSLERTSIGTGIFITTIGVTTKRIFNQLANGDIIMQEQVSFGGYGVGIPIFLKRTQWVRWTFIQQPD